MKAEVGEGQTSLPQPQSCVPSGLSQNLALDVPQAEALSESSRFPNLLSQSRHPEGAGGCKRWICPSASPLEWLGQRSPLD